MKKKQKTKHKYIRKDGYWECILCGDNFIARGYIGKDKNIPDAWIYCEDAMKLYTEAVMDRMKKT